MNVWRLILTLFFSANFWICTIHCQAELNCVSSISSDLDHSSSSSDHGCENCNVCDWVHSGSILISNKLSYDFTQTIVFNLLNFQEIIVDSSLSHKLSLGKITGAPPDLIKTWQFAFRTALPVRAPSVLS